MDVGAMTNQARSEVVCSGLTQVNGRVSRVNVG
jgi:hypothetical protein